MKTVAQEQEENILLTIYHAEALNTCASRSVHKMAHKLKYSFNIFKKEYEKSVVPELTDEHKNNIALVKLLAQTCVLVNSKDLPYAIGLLQALNEGKLIKKEDEQK